MDGQGSLGLIRVPRPANEDLEEDAADDEQDAKDGKWQHRSPIARCWRPWRWRCRRVGDSRRVGGRRRRRWLDPAVAEGLGDRVAGTAEVRRAELVDRDDPIVVVVEGAPVNSIGDPRGKVR